VTALDPITALAAAAAVIAVGSPIGILAVRRRAETLVLCCITGELRGRMFGLMNGLRIGRSAECALRLNDAAVSRRHAVLEQDGRRVRLRDEGSCTGVWSDGRRLFHADLSQGDQFQIGENVFALLSSSDAQIGALPAARMHCGAVESSVQAEMFEPDAWMHTGAHYVVMRARRTDGSVCVLKYLHDRRESVRSRLDAYLSAATLRTAAHPVLVRVCGGSASAPQPHVIEDFADGPSLRMRMTEGMPHADARRVMSQLLTEFEHLHRVGISHGALDAGDVMFLRDGSMKLLGVGAAQIFDGARNHFEDDVAALAGLGDALLGSAPRHARVRSIAELRRRWGIDRQIVPPMRTNVSFLPLRLRVRGIDAVKTVTSNPFVLGRALNPVDRSLSRRHAELVFRSNRWIVRPRRDVRTFQNGVLLTADSFVAVGDELKLGETVLVIAE